MRTNEELHQFVIDRRLDRDYAKLCETFHPTDSRYVDPLFGEYRGRDTITAWLVEIMGTAGSGKAGNTGYEDVVPPLLMGDTSVSEWRQLAFLPDGTKQEMGRGCGIRRYRDGFMIYAADYFDTHWMRQKAAQELGRQMGATVSASDIPRGAKDLGAQMAERIPQDAMATGPAEPPQRSVLDLWRLERAAWTGAGGSDVVRTLFQPEATFRDALAGEISGGEAIADWMAASDDGVETVSIDPVTEPLVLGGTLVVEWLMVQHGDGGSQKPIVRGCSVRRSEGGRLVYGANYYDTYPVRKAFGIPA